MRRLSFQKKKKRLWTDYVRIIVFSWLLLWGVVGVQSWHLTNLVLFCCLCSNMKTNDEVVENICVLFSELVEYGKLTVCNWVEVLSSF